MSRLLIVCRHFWPVSNATAYRIAELVRFLHRQNIEAQILTTRWHNSWPIQSTFNEVPLTRILPASTTAWNEGYFQRNLWSWAEKNHDHFDVCYVDSLDLISNAKLSSALKDKLLLLRVDLNNARDREAFKRPSATLQSLASSGKVRFLVQSASDHRIIIGAGIASSRVIRVEPVVAPSQRNSASKESARAILGSVGIDYLVPERFPLIVLLFDGEDYNAEHAYLKALSSSLEGHATFRAWVFGANDQIRRHYSYLRDMGFHHDVLLHSSFDDINTVYDAADLIVSSNTRDAKAFYYPLALARAVPTIFAPTLESKLAENNENTSISELMSSLDADPSLMEQTFHDFIANPASFEASAMKLQQRVQWPMLEKYNAGVWRQLLSLT